MKKLLCLLLLSLLSLNILADNKTDLSVAAIPDSLKTNANGVVRYSTTEFEYKSEKTGVERHTMAITVFNKNGKGLANFVCSVDKFRELKRFSAELFDANGKSLRKFKLSDVSSTEWSSSLATDAKYYYLEPQSPSFPYTIRYEYEVYWKEGIFLFPPFIPQDNFQLSVEEAEYRLLLPTGMPFRSKALNMSATPESNEQNKVTTYSWKQQQLTAIDKEAFPPPLKSLVPILYLSPESFVYDKTPGTITDWNSYGAWIYSLMEGRDQLPADCINKVKELTRQAADTREKVKILYDYLAETTRYVSIQLGIGGYQPMPAAEVYKTGFGDCKALTYYLKSLLAAVDIPSNYVGIRLDEQEKRLFADYPGFHEINHVILQVPLATDTLWLECTNTNIPFGYIHDAIAGHDALEITQEGGRLCRLPDYPDSLNLEINQVEINILPDGSAQSKAYKQYHVKIYDSYFGFNRQQTKEQIDYLREEIALPNATISDLSVVENKTELPFFDINYSWQTSLYGTKTGNRLFLPTNPFRTGFNNFKKKERNLAINRWFGFKDDDNLLITLPDEYEIESLPQPVILETAFGTFTSLVLPTDQGIRITQSLLVRSGLYDPALYEEMSSFFSTINAAYNGRIVLRKK
ncbi:DUF3857 domain-containing protein [Parabacteroides sp. OttesenSCG-928-N08]|nr:DUF3857 domain-containing protein [Parabacteroides sp. OttesenSCG-928-N08]